MTHLEQVRSIVLGTLGLGATRLDEDTALLGNMPELDSLAVILLITALEQHFGMTVDDDEINARHFATLGSLSSFVSLKLAP
ncbi:MAG: acyl carrier protein [Janthinobacterium sp.]|jgi:acyl carrier protein